MYQLRNLHQPPGRYRETSPPSPPCKLVSSSQNPRPTCRQDDLYSNCDGATNWEEFKLVFKQAVEQKGCNGAAQAMPAVAIVAIAVNTRALSCSVTG